MNVMNLFFVSVVGLAAATYADTPVMLTHGDATLHYAGKGFVLQSHGIASTPTERPYWSLLLEPETTPQAQCVPTTLRSDEQPSPMVSRSEKSFTLLYTNLVESGRSYAIALKITCTATKNGFEFQGEIANQATGWRVCSFIGPIFDNLAVDLHESPFLTATGFGKRINQVGTQAPWKPSGNPDQFEYPSDVYPGAQASMQWCAFAGATQGLYIGSHDAEHHAKAFCLRYNATNQMCGVAIKHLLFCASNAKVAIPPVLIVPYTGSWHAAAKIYRTWFDTIRPMRQVPEWTKTASGWLLCILKQQNGQIMWRYPDLPQLAKLADERGLDIIGLFGWAQGGHDHLYPDYIPDEQMGGRDALVQALKEIRKMGKRSIIYANGQLQEREVTEFWRTVGKDIAIQKRDGATFQHTYHKFSDIPIYRFDLGCTYAQAWFDRMLQLAEQANDLGADGILFDQLAMMSPMACYGTHHGHATPCMVHESERPSFLLRIADHMRTINPNFIVMTEGIHDSALSAISMFHACQLGAFRATRMEMNDRLARTRMEDPFPELFRYTFPELLTTDRIPSPMKDRDCVNYACLYGLRNEIESRYQPDTDYLKTNRIPAKDEYKTVISKPDLAMMAQNDPVESARYLKCVIDFQRKQSATLLKGMFADSQGFTIDRTDIPAKAFQSNEGTAVLIWNTQAEAAQVAVTVPGKTLVSAEDPERGAVDPKCAIPPNTLRLTLWK